MHLSMTYGIKVSAAKSFEVALRQQYNTSQKNLLSLQLPFYFTLEALLLTKGK